MVTWRFPARTKVMGIRSLDLRHETDGGPLTLRSVLVYSDNQPFTLNATAQPTAGVMGPWTTQLAFSAFDTTAAAVGTMDVSGNYDLQVEAQSGSLDKLDALLPQMRLPAMHQATLSTHLTNGPVPGDLPVIGTTHLHFSDADMTARIPGLDFSAVDLSLPTAGALATVTGTGTYSRQGFKLGRASEWNGVMS